MTEEDRMAASSSSTVACTSQLDQLGDRRPGRGGQRAPAGTADLLEQLDSVVAAIASVSFDGLLDAELERFLDGLRGPITRLEATRSSGFADLERRAARRAPAGGATAAELEQRRRNARRQRLTPSAAKRAAQAGRAAADHAVTGTAFRSGDLGTDHARLIGELLRRIPPPLREEVERRLVGLARQLDPVAFGRAARELVGREAPEAAAHAERGAADRRSFRASDTPDGGFAFGGLLHGTAAETARAALQAFRRPDTPDEHRSSEQAGADAFEQLCEAALRVGDAPTDHGVRPHVVVVVDEADLCGPAGVARLAHSAQPVTTGAIGHLLDDCTVSRIVRDAAGTPVSASEAVRTVPAGLWKALLVRDGGCTWNGCDAPASWCDVAHGQHAFHTGGRLSPGNAALLCRRHHRRFDTGRYRVVIAGDQVRYERVDVDGAANLQHPHRSAPLATSARVTITRPATTNRRERARLRSETGPSRSTPRERSAGPRSRSPADGSAGDRAGPLQPAMRSLTGGGSDPP